MFDEENYTFSSIRVWKILGLYNSSDYVLIAIGFYNHFRDLEFKQ